MRDGGCTVNDAQRERLIHRLKAVIDESEDSLRVYLLRGGRDGAAECYGLDRYQNLKSDPLFV